MLKHLREQLTPPDHINPELSIGSAEIIEAMMAKDRKDRYQSTQELLQDLKAVRQGKPPIHARKLFDMSQLSNLETDAEIVETPAGARFGTPRRSSDMALWKTSFFVVLSVLFFSILLNIIQALTK
jgi:serine/threonine-protein kinase